MAKASGVKGVGAQRKGRGAARLVLEARLGDVRRHEDGAEALVADGIHDLRVATRRLRAALKHLGGDERLLAYERRVKALQDALGDVRDAQLQLQWLHGRQDPPSRKLSQRLEAALPKREETLEKRLGRWRKRDAPRLALLIAKAKVHPLGKRRARGRLWKHLLRWVEEAAALGGLKDPAQAHALRIRAKKLKYEAELLREVQPAEIQALVKLLTPVQDALGELHDLDVRTEQLQEAAGDPSAAAAVRPLRLRREKEAQRALEPWRDRRTVQGLRRKLGPGGASA